MAIKVFLTGATGYIGGSILSRLLTTPDASKYSVTVLVRGKDHADRIANCLDVTVVQGSLDDLELIEKTASECDVVINAASAQNQPAAVHLIHGLSKRIDQGKPAHFIHTSGTSILADRAAGEYLDEKVWPDTEDIYAMESSDAEYILRETDVAIVQTSQKERVKSYIVAPPTIYGAGTGPVKRTSHQVPELIRASVAAGKVQYIGKGASAWTHVHIDDLAVFYVDVLLPAALADKAPHGREGYYFAETGEHTWRALAENLATVLYAKDLIPSPTASPFPSLKAAGDALAGGSELFANIPFGSNSRARAVRSRQIGWKPSKPDEHFFGYLGEEVDFVLMEDKRTGGPKSAFDYSSYK